MNFSCISSKNGCPWDGWTPFWLKPCLYIAITLYVYVTCPFPKGDHCSRFWLYEHAITALHVGPGLALAEPSGVWHQIIVLGWLENLNFFHTNHMLGTLDFAGSEHWAPFNFPRSTAMRTALPSPPQPPPPPPGQRHHSINRLRENRSRATKGKLRGGGEGRGQG